MQSSLLTALWNHYKQKEKQDYQVGGMQQVWPFAVFKPLTQNGAG